MSETTTSAILIPWAQTDWQIAGRYATSTPISINKTGEDQIEAWARLIARHQPGVIYGPETGPGEQTAARLAGLLGIKPRRSTAFSEVALGLWEGLAPGELKKRFGRAYRQWREDPASVCPPEGEPLAPAIERLAQEIKKQGRKHVAGCLGVVLGPLSFAAVRCHLDGKPYSRLWEVPFDQPVRYLLDLDEDTAMLTLESRLAS
jgi:broad specificity phosphatase PhoE